VAGTIATVGLTLAAPTLADFAVELGDPDYVALTVVALITVSALLGSSVSRGLASLGIGLLLGLVGTDNLTGQQRFTFGLPVLGDGIDVVTFAVGVFAVGEALWVASRLRHGPLQIVPVGGSWMTRQDFRRSWRPWLRGTALGFPIGAMPAGGAEIPTFLSYAVEKKLSRHKDEFGTTGAIEGVAGPEAANNAAAAGVLVPLLTLGLPTSATAAVLIAAFQGFGIQPGPLLFDKEPDLVWALIASLYIGNVLLLVLNLPLVGLWVRLLRIPRPYLYAGILMFAALGGYALNGVTTDLWVLLAIGVLGYVMRRFGYPIAPAVIGLILGPIAEEHLRRTLAISQGDATALVTTPFAATIYILLAIGIVATLVLRRRAKRVLDEIVHPEAEVAS
jgi:putative tricarboxylic transport membrane protein